MRSIFGRVFFHCDVNGHVLTIEKQLLLSRNFAQLLERSLYGQLDLHEAVRNPMAVGYLSP